MSALPDHGSAQPHLHPARSFPRMETSDINSTMANTAPEQMESTTQPISLSANNEGEDTGSDVFERRGSADSGAAADGQGEEGFVLSRSVQDPSEELPIELISLTDRFVTSLSARVHNSPPTIDRIAQMFQVFYTRAESHIATHISALQSRINRDPSPHVPVPAKPPRGGLSKLSNKRSQDNVAQAAPGRQMLTASEVEEKRKARKALECKRLALEEAAERRACELVYEKIWRHKNTLDEIRDEKLRSKTAALLLVGINLKDLGVDVDFTAVSDEKQNQANDCLAQARECLAKMNDERYPLGKLHQLAAAHKAIVDALTKLLPSSSSADEILPTLIYSLVTCPSEGINIISNLLFIQRFRSSNKFDGETAYCLTNLEAAISFLENVDLSSLRADELQEGSVKTPSDATTTAPERIDPMRPAKETATSSVTPVSATSELLKPDPKETASSTMPKPRSRSSPIPQQRRLSNLLQPPSKVLGAANDAVRSTADQGLKNIGATLDSSFNFLFGRLKELQINQGPDPQGGGAVVPKTLAEARRLVTSPTGAVRKQNLAQDDLLSTTPEPVGEGMRARSSSKTTGLSNESRIPREPSADSARTQESSKRSIAASTSLRDEPTSNLSQTPSWPASPTPLESMRSFGNTLNPLTHIPGMIKSFGRNAPDSPGRRSVSPAAVERLKSSPASVEEVSGTASPLPASSMKIDPPIQRFLAVQDAHELRIGDVAMLLEDYKRLAAALYKPGAES